MDTCIFGFLLLKSVVSVNNLFLGFCDEIKVDCTVLLLHGEQCVLQVEWCMIRTDN